MARLESNLRKMLESDGEDRVKSFLSENLESKELAPENFSIRDLAEELIPDGREFVRACNPRKSGGFTSLQEANAVTTTQFSNITGQIFFNKMLQGYQQEEFILSRAVKNVPTQLSGERIPGIGDLGDQAAIVGEGGAYPLAGVNEDYIDSPQTTKRGFIVPVTKEAIFFDRTGLLLQRCQQVGEALGINKEKRLIDAFIDENTTAARYKWRGTVYANFQASTPWINTKASNGLTDWTNVDASEQIFANLLDPNTGEPIVMLPNTIFSGPNLRSRAAIILGATQISAVTPGFATSANPNQTFSPSPIGKTEFSVGSYTWMGSRLFYSRMATTTNWYQCDLARYLSYMENWPITVTQAPANSEAEFMQDIVVRYKASERGAAMVDDPRACVKNTA